MLRYRRGAAALAAVICVATSVAACGKDSGPADTVKLFLDGWQSGHLDRVGFVSTAGETVTASSIAAEIKALSGDLAPLPRVLIGNPPAVTGSEATAQISVEQTVVTGVVWRYHSTIRLHSPSKGTWAVVWSPDIIHPRLAAGDTMVVHRVPASRASIRDGAGGELFKDRPVVVVGVQPSQIDDIDQLVAALHSAFVSAHVDVDLSDLPAAVGRAAADQFVEVVTLRRDVYDAIRSKIHDLPGTVFRDSSLYLAPSRNFARALLGTVGEVTKEQLDAHPGRYYRGQQIGQSGLQAQYDDALGGTDGVAVVKTSATKPTDGTPAQETQLFRAAPKAGTPLNTTLDQRVQNAADGAVAGSATRAAIVAIRVSDGSLLAVANGPAGADLDLALTAQVPPGSTFKTVTALALLGSGQVTAQTVVDCPKTFTVAGRGFTNAGGFALGPVPFHTDFARSCNTAFASLYPKLGSDGLAKAAASVGIGVPWHLGTDAFTGSVATGAPAVEAAAAAFGQGKTLVSPASLAGAAAAVAHGSWLAPTLVLAAAGATPVPSPAAAPLNPDAISALRAMMREVVTAGTASGLRDVPGGPVSAKTGTAEFDNNPAHTHAWVMGFQGDVAFAVFVENGGSSSATAVPIAASFLRALN
jgi:cell division protein FtsI/penicillin-binding protein 2